MPTPPSTRKLSQAEQNCSPSHLAEIPDAPVFRPTLEEFQDPIAYIRSIWNKACSAGICKIIPPPAWCQGCNCNALRSTAADALQPSAKAVNSPTSVLEQHRQASPLKCACVHASARCLPKALGGADGNSALHSRLREIPESASFPTRLQALHDLRYRHRGVNRRFHSLVEQVHAGAREAVELPPTIRIALTNVSVLRKSGERVVSEGILGSGGIVDGMAGIEADLPSHVDWIVDLYALHGIVLALGGYHAVERGGQWAAVARELGMPDTDENGLDSLAEVYITYLLPLSQWSEVVDFFPESPNVVTEDSGSGKPGRDSIQTHEVRRRDAPEQKDSIACRQKRSSRARVVHGGDCASGVGRAYCRTRHRGKKGSDSRGLQEDNGPAQSAANGGADLVAMVANKDTLAPCESPRISCHTCWVRFEKGESTVACMVCGRAFHDSCFESVFRPAHAGGRAGLVCKGGCSYGYSEGKNRTLAEFRALVKQSKALKKPLQKLCIGKRKCPGQPPSLCNATDDWRSLEADYWKIIECPTRAVYVEYGSDLDTAQIGSGFPKPGQLRSERLCAKQQSPFDSWNLNVLPTSSGSLLKYLPMRIEGVTVPWLYCGGLFATFCYHTEDLNMMSVNYMHEGDGSASEGKVWYGSPPGLDALHFEAAMRASVPELYEANPRLQYELVTMVSPVELCARGARVFRALQRPGEFILTFPQSYHGGFSLGFNICEAVNFVLPECLPWMNAAALRCQMLRQPTVFSLPGFLISACKRMYLRADLQPHEVELLVSEVEYNVNDEAVRRFRVQSMLCGYCDKMDGGCKPGDYCDLCRQSCALTAVSGSAGKDLLCLQCVLEHPELCPSTDLPWNEPGTRPYTMHCFEDLAKLQGLAREVRAANRTLLDT